LVITRAYFSAFGITKHDEKGDQKMAIVLISSARPYLGKKRILKSFLLKDISTLQEGNKESWRLL